MCAFAGDSLDLRCTVSEVSSKYLTTKLSKHRKNRILVDKCDAILPRPRSSTSALKPRLTIFPFIQMKDCLGGLPDYICLEHTPCFYWYLTKISFKLMINLCNPACILKMACLSLPQPHKREAALSLGGKLRLGKQMRQRYLPGARLDNEDESSDQRAIS